jgi:hypothetical protein
VAIIEKHFLTIGADQRVQRAELSVPIREVQHELLHTEKIFTVDFKRPAAGTMKMSLDFKDQQQYFSSIEHEVVDKTIEEVSNLLGTIAPGGIFTRVSSKSAAKFDQEVKEVESVVAARVFELDDPDFERQLSAFLDCHISQSHDAWVVPPGVRQIRRIPLSSETFDETRDPLCPGPNCGVQSGPLEVRRLPPAETVPPTASPVGPR